MPANLQKQMLGGDGVMRYIDSTSAIASGSGYLFDYVIINDSATVVSVLEDENGVSRIKRPVEHRQQGLEHGYPPHREERCSDSSCHRDRWVGYWISIEGLR